MKVFKIKVAPYGRKVLCLIGGDTDKVKKVLSKAKGVKKREWDKIDLKDCVGYTFMFDKGLTLIWLKKAPDKFYFKGILAHEIVHAIDFIMSYVGVTRDNDANESFAYLTGWLTEQIYKKLK